MAALLGLLTTAFSFSLFMDGLRYLRVQHASIMAYIEPVSAPLYALVFLGQRPSVWTIAGGALIVAAGLLVVLYARGEPDAGAARMTRRDPLGYGIVLLSYLGMAGSAPLVAWADAPEAIILMLRMGFAALALGVVFLRRPMIDDWRRPGAAWRLCRHGGDVVAHAAAVLLRRAPHQRRHRHVPALPDAGLGRAGGAARLPLAARAHRVAGARPRPRRPGRHPCPRPAGRGRRTVARRPRCGALHRASATPPTRSP